ncbi:MAG: hypothetical protein AMXMBFR60_06220 [Chloroflexota bacterium]
MRWAVFNTTRMAVYVNNLILDMGRRMRAREYAANNVGRGFRANKRTAFYIRLWAEL